VDKLSRLQIPRKARKIASVDGILEMDALPHEKKGKCARWGMGAWHFCFRVIWSHL